MRSNWFIALPISAGNWFAQLPAPPPGVRQFHPLDLHLTIAFLGSVSVEAAQRAFEQVQAWPTGALELYLGVVEPFGNPRRPSAYAARIAQGHDLLVAVMNQVRGEMWTAAEAQPDPRPPLPHVTLARPRRRATDLDRQQGLAWAQSLNLGLPQVWVDEIALYTGAAERKQQLFEIVLRRSLDTVVV